jgi:uncharacterized protein YkuJ
MLSSALGVIKKVKSLEEAFELTDGEKQYFSFGGKVMKSDGYFSKEQIFDNIETDWWWFLLLGLILTLVFTVIINSY